MPKRTGETVKSERLAKARLTAGNGGLRRWKFRLYVAGKTANCLRALANLNRICEEYLAGNFKIEVVDLDEEPHLSHEDRVLAIPTLVRSFPQPARKVIGDLSNREQTLARLDLDPVHAQ